MINQALILAAGRGLRMGDATDGLPKCLLSLGPETILDFQLRVLSWAGVKRLGIVTGYCAEAIKNQAGARVTEWFHNDDYDSTNSLFSFYCAREFAEEGTLVLNSDVVFEPQLLKQLIEAPEDCALLYDPSHELGEEEMKVAIDQQGIVQRLSKALSAEEAAGENLGLVKFGPGAANQAFAALQENHQQRFRNLWLPECINYLAGARAFRALSIQGRPWTEIDYAEDLRFAREEIYPKCAAALGALS